MSSEKTTSISKVILMKRGIQECLSSDQGTKEFSLSKNLQAALRNRFPNIEERTVMATSTFLDPRLKHIGFSMESGIQKAKAEIIDQMSRRDQELTVSAKAVQNASLPSSSTSAPPAATTSIWAKFDQKAHKHIQERGNVIARPQVELTRYQQEPLIARENNPLDWWKEKESMFTLMKHVAKKYLCIPATSVPSERLFSKAGELVSHRRNGISGKNVNMVLFLNKNNN